MTDEEVLKALDFAVKCRRCDMYAGTAAVQSQCQRCGGVSLVEVVCYRCLAIVVGATHPRCSHCESHGIPGLITFAHEPLPDVP